MTLNLGLRVEEVEGMSTLCIFFVLIAGNLLFEIKSKEMDSVVEVGLSGFLQMVESRHL